MAQAKGRESLSEMTDGELIAACRLRPWEQRLASIGCVVPLVVSIAFGYEAYSRGWFTSISGTAIFVLVSSFVLFLPLMQLQHVRARHHAAELALRYGQASLSLYVQQARSRIGGLGAPDWILLFQGSGLPHGNRSYIEIHLWRDTDHPSTLIRCEGTPVWRISEQEPRFEKGEREIPASETDLLSTYCSGLQLSDMSDVVSMVKDGFPCTVVAIRKQPFEIGQGQCNLSGIPTTEAGKPVPKLAAMLWQIAQLLPMTPSMTGSCDAYGTIKIKDL